LWKNIGLGKLGKALTKTFGQRRGDVKFKVVLSIFGVASNNPFNAVLNESEVAVEMMGAWTRLATPELDDVYIASCAPIKSPAVERGRVTKSFVFKTDIKPVEFHTMRLLQRPHSQRAYDPSLTKEYDEFAPVLAHKIQVFQKFLEGRHVKRKVNFVIPFFAKLYKPVVVLWTIGFHAGNRWASVFEVRFLSVKKH
jgi:hypothetical protein